MKKIFTLLTLLVALVTSAWATDYTLASSTFNSGKTIATVGGVEFTLDNAHGGSGQSNYTDYIKFSKNKTYTITLPDGFKLTNINIKGYTNSNGKTDGEITSIGGNAQTGKTFPAKDDANLATNACITDGYDFAISQTGGSVAITTANTNQICVLITITGTAPAAVAVDPVFSLSRTSISTLQTAQIKVGTKEGLDGITLSNITYGTPDVVTVDAETGVVTAAGVGTTTINFNSGAVADKYKASTGNSLTITVTEAITVFDADGLYNQQIILSQANIEDKDYLSCNSSYWADKGWSSPYNGSFLDMKTDRKITLKVKNAYSFELYLSGTADRTYNVKVGDEDAVEYTQGGTGSGFVSSGVIATGTTGEVTIEIEGGANTLYPVYFIVNPAVTASFAAGKEYITFASEYALDCTTANLPAGLKAYKATGASASSVTIEEVNSTVNAGTGLLLQRTGDTSAAGNFDIPVVASGTNISATNKLVGVTAAAGAAIGGDGVYDYVLKDGKFYHASAGTLAQGKAYLHLDAEPAAPVLSIDFGGNTTGIDEIRGQKEEIRGEYFNLNGQRVANPTKGLYIVNGKKVILK